MADDVHIFELSMGHVFKLRRRFKGREDISADHFPEGCPISEQQEF